MKRTLLALIVALVFVLPPNKPAAAQTPDPDKTQPIDREDQATPDQHSDDVTAQDRADRTDRADRARRRGRRQAPDTPLELARKLPKLKMLMWETLDLDRAQKDTLSDLFDEEIGRLKALHAEARGADAQSEQLDQARDLQKDLMEARKSGDRERARELRQALGRVLGNSRSRGQQPVRIGGFLRNVRDELSESQRPQLGRLIRKAGIQQGRRGASRPMQAFRRALFSPEVDLSQDQRREVMQLMREARPPRNPRRRNRERAERNGGGESRRNNIQRHEGNQNRGRPTPEQQAEQFKQFEQSVLELLDDQQRERLESVLEKMKSEPQDSFERRRNRGPRRGRGRDRDEF